MFCCALLLLFHFGFSSFYFFVVALTALLCVESQRRQIHSALEHLGF